MLRFRNCVFFERKLKGVLFLIAMMSCTQAREEGLISGRIDLSDATIVVPGGTLPQVEMTAIEVLQEEIRERTGILWETSGEVPKEKPAIVILARPQADDLGLPVPEAKDPSSPELRPEGYRLLMENTASERPVLWVIGADPRGVLFGVGRLLRLLESRPDSVTLSGELDLATAPAYRIRGHQIGFRARANSWDSWDEVQFEKYFRELAIFGINSIENIPFQDETVSPLMKVSRETMNRQMSDICAKYGLDYWLWTPADFDLRDESLRVAELKKHADLYRDCKELTAVFFPGGDPGSNPPELVIPFLEDIGALLMKEHPNARVWLSLQWFNDEQIDFIYSYIEKEKPDWLGGLVGGPSSPPAKETRNRLPRSYPIRLYPDLTHNKLCQYPVAWWDQSLALTLGREAINPRPVEFAEIHNRFAPFSDGFISYSDGVHDDVNKTIFSARSWDPGVDVREVLIEYSNFFFGPDVAERAADGILALEKNWHGPVATNGSIESTLYFWQQLEAESPQLKANWRWQMNLLRAYFDAYTRQRLLYEQGLEAEANDALSEAPSIGAIPAMEKAKSILNRAVTDRSRPDLYARVEDLCEGLFHSIGLQTSVERYHASGAERGAFLDFVDYPLNNRWWLEDEFPRIAAMESEPERLARLEIIRTWENPGEGSYYDDIGNPSKSTHLVRPDPFDAHRSLNRTPSPTLWWLEDGKSRARLAWQVTMAWPLGVQYEGLDSKATYTVRLTGYGQSLLRIDGELVQPTVDGQGFGEFKEFPVPPECLLDGELLLTWDRPTNEGGLNWRQRSRLAEIWLLKQ